MPVLIVIKLSDDWKSIGYEPLYIAIQQAAINFHAAVFNAGGGGIFVRISDVGSKLILHVLKSLACVSHERWRAHRARATFPAIDEYVQLPAIMPAKAEY